MDVIAAMQTGTSGSEAAEATPPVADGPGREAATLGWPVTENKEKVKEGLKRKTNPYYQTRIIYRTKHISSFKKKKEKASEQ